MGPVRPPAEIDVGYEAGIEAVRYSDAVLGDRVATGEAWEFGDSKMLAAVFDRVVSHAKVRTSRGSTADADVTALCGCSRWHDVEHYRRVLSDGLDVHFAGSARVGSDRKAVVVGRVAGAIEPDVQ